MSYYKKELFDYYKRSLASNNVVYITGASRFGEVNPKIVELGNYGVTKKGLSVKTTTGANKTVNEGDPISIFESNTNITPEAYFEAFKTYYTKDDGKNWKDAFCKNL